MTKTAEAPTTLADKDVWIIDDDIPINRAGFDDEDLLNGKRPIDRGALLALLTYVDWANDPVRILCEELVHEAGNVTAFTQPIAAISYLNSGAAMPDVVVYDLVYRNLPTGKNSLEYLENLLRRCVFVVQVYTQESPDDAARHLEALRKQFPSRLESPRHKTDTNAKELARVIGERLKSSLSAWLAKKVRQSSFKAIEEVLVKIDDLPFDVAIKMLAGKSELPEELELIELLSVKVGEALEISTGLNKALVEYAKKKKFPQDRVNRVAQEIVALLVSHVCEHIQNDGNLFGVIQDAWQKLGQENVNNDERTKQILKEFFAFRLYTQPRDTMVRTGDIVALQTENDPLLEPPDLYLVLTPACDLVRFWKKTRGSITLLKMYPIQDRGMTRTKSYGNPNKFDLKKSIAAGHPMVMPSVPIMEDKFIDYALFAYEVHTLEIENADLVSAGENNKKANSPLTYSDVDKKIIRKCRISEPFLTGILAAVQGVLFRFGIPDYPEDEYKRLKGLFNG